MPELPTVSIVIPTFNQVDLLQEALSSVIAQTYEDWEAEIIDNQSNDGTQSMVQSFNEPRFRYSWIKNNGIIAASRNQAIRNARGEWVAFLDSDDLWMPEKINSSLAAVEPAVDLICHRESTVLNGQILRTSPSYDDKWPTYRNLLFKGNCFSPSAVMVRRRCLIEASGFLELPEFVTCEDYDLWLRLAENGMGVRFISPVLSHYRLHTSNTSSSVENHMNAGLAVIDSHFSALNSKNIFHSLYHARRRSETIYGAGRAHNKFGDLAKARYCYFWAIRECPVLVRSYVALLMSFFPLRAT